MASFEQVRQGLLESKQGSDDFFQVILMTLTSPESYLPDGDKPVAIAIVDFAKMQLAKFPEEFNKLVEDLVNYLVNISETEASKALLHHLLQAQDNLGRETTSGPETNASVQPAIAPQLVEQITTPAAKAALQTLEESKKTNDDYQLAIIQTLTMPLSDQEKCLPCAILDMAYKKWNRQGKGNLNKLQPLLDALKGVDCDPAYDSGTAKLLACRADEMQGDIDALYGGRGSGSDTDDSGSGPAPQDSPNTGAVRRVAMRISGREVGLYVTSQRKAPLILTLLNGLALSDEEPCLAVDGADMLSMIEMQDVVISICKAKLISMHAAKRWEPLVKCLDCSEEEAENADENGKISDFLTEMKRDLLKTYFELPTMPNQKDALSMCYRLFEALDLDIKGWEEAFDDCLASSQDGPGKIRQGLSDQHAAVNPVQLVDEGERGSDVAMAENAEKVLKRKASSEARDEKEKEEKDAAANKKLVKEQGFHDASLTGSLAAEGPPDSKVQDVKDVVQRSEEGEPWAPAFHVAPEMPMLDRNRFEDLRQVSCEQGSVRTFLYIAKPQGTLHVMARFEDDLYVLNQMEGPKGGSHGQGPVPRWFRLTWGITYVPCDL